MTQISPSHQVSGERGLCGSASPASQAAAWCGDLPGPGVSFMFSLSRAHQETGTLVLMRGH
jgi:hypothetical protein